MSSRRGSLPAGFYWKSYCQADFPVALQQADVNYEQVIGRPVLASTRE